MSRAMGEWTPGKWVVSGEGMWQHVFTEDMKHPICRMIYETDYPTMKKNAHLIASAPELYEALKKLYEECKSECWDENDPALLKAEKALAKARGEE